VAAQEPRRSGNKEVGACEVSALTPSSTLRYTAFRGLGGREGGSNIAFYPGLSPMTMRELRGSKAATITFSGSCTRLGVV